MHPIIKHYCEIFKEPYEKIYLPYVTVCKLLCFSHRKKALRGKMQCITDSQ